MKRIVCLLVMLAVSVAAHAGPKDNYPKGLNPDARAIHMNDAHLCAVYAG